MDSPDPLQIVGIVAVVVALATIGWAVQRPEPGDVTAPPGSGAADSDAGDAPSPSRTRVDAGTMDVTIERTDPTTETLAYPIQDPDGDPIGNRSWRVIEGTGNCCENYITTTPAGRVVDLGGTYPVYSGDAGRSWVQVRSVAPGVNGEGAIAVAPNGDVLAVMWDPYSGDRLLSYKYDAEQQRWDYAETPLKTPFFDRPWLSVVPGPIDAPDGSAPYAAYVRGGYPSNEVGYLSLDGLHYTRPMTPSGEAVGSDEATISVEARPAADWTQPHTEGRMTPLPTGGLVVHQPAPGQCAWKLLTPDLSWRCLEVPGLDGGRLLVDARGRLHNVVETDDDVVYRVSPDDGETWRETRVDLSDRFNVESWDAKVLTQENTSVVALHVHDTERRADQDLVLRFDVTTDRARLVRRALVGAGDLNAGAGAGADDRFDFITAGFLPDGRIAVSFTDRDHHPPALAIQTGQPDPR